MSRNVSLQALLEQLKQSSRINLSDMYIGDEGAKQLVQYIQNNKNLKFLELRGNNITSDGLIFIYIYKDIRITSSSKILQSVEDFVS